MSGYSNITVKGQSQKVLVEYLAQRGIATYVSPRKNDYTVVYPEDQLEECAADLSTHFQCPAFAVLEFDGDVWLYWLYDKGILIDEYNSSPSYGEDGPDLPPSGGNSETLCTALGVDGLADQIEPILRHENVLEGGSFVGDYKMSSDLHSELVELLGLPPFAVNCSYEYVDFDDEPGGLLRDDFEETP